VCCLTPWDTLFASVGMTADRASALPLGKRRRTVCLTHPDLDIGLSPTDPHSRTGTEWPFANHDAGDCTHPFPKFRNSRGWAVTEPRPLCTADELVGLVIGTRPDHVKSPTDRPLLRYWSERRLISSSVSF
jgi:hypothetical protein